MRQQLNLNDPRFAPHKVRCSAHQVGLAAGALTAVLAVVQVGMHLAAARLEAQARDDDAAMAPLRSQLVKLAGQNQAAPQAAELPTLKAMDAVQRRVGDALASGMAGSREGPAGYFGALARQASGSVWITGLSISEDGQSIELEGRMLDPAALTAYLRRLNAEPHFRGRPFAQLNLRSAEPHPGSAAGTPVVTEFALRSSAAASGAGS